MFPELWIFDTYSIMLFIGAFSAIVLFYFYSVNRKFEKNFRLDIEILAVVSIIVGLGSAMLFQWLFDALKGDGEHNHFSMTFFGGLVGGVVMFVFIYIFYIRKKYPQHRFIEILIIAPACITLAHAFGRIGCFLAGCCYGKETDSFLGVKFPDLPNKVFPTQLFEATFLFIIAGILFYLAMKKDFKYTMPVYLISYGIFRFMIEFIRGDERGAFILGLSPSQWFSIVALGIGIALIFIIPKKFIDKKDENN